MDLKQEKKTLDEKDLEKVAGGSDELLAKCTFCGKIMATDEFTQHLRIRQETGECPE